MAESAIDRTVRALDLVPFVTAHPGVQISELAKKFNVSEKQIIKDLELIFLCGLPGYTPYELIDLTFEDGLVTVIDPQLLDKPRQFSETESVILNLGLMLIKSITVNPDQLHLINELLAKLADKFQHTKHAILSKIDKPKFYEELQNYINSGDSISIKYQSISSDLITTRSIRPIGINFKNGFFYLLGFDLKSGDERTFRVDQLIEIAKNPMDQKQAEYSIDQASSIEFILESRDRLFTEKYRDIFSKIEEKRGIFSIHGVVSNRAWLLRWLLSNCGSVKVISPDWLKDNIADRANSALKLYSHPTNGAQQQGRI